MFVWKFFFLSCAFMCQLLIEFRIRWEMTRGRGITIFTGFNLFDFKCWQRKYASFNELTHFIQFTETIVNEHPVTIYGTYPVTPEFLNELKPTIYPGPLPQKRVPPRTLPGSIERHRDVCRKNPSSDLSSSSSQELQSPIRELTSPTIQSSNGFILKNDDFIKRPKSPTPTASKTNATSFGIKISIQSMDNLMNNRNIIHNAKLEQKMNMRNSKRNSRLSDKEDDDEDKFSDDSLEDTSLPPPAPPPVSMHLWTQLGIIWKSVSISGYSTTPIFISSRYSQ